MAPSPPASLSAVVHSKIFSSGCPRVAYKRGNEGLLRGSGFLSEEM